MPIDLKAVTISKSSEFPKWLISLYKKKQHKNQKETRFIFTVFMLLKVVLLPCIFVIF